MPLIQKQNQETPKSRWSSGPAQIDRGQFEYTASTLLTYGTILFLAVGVAASVAYMTVHHHENGFD